MASENDHWIQRFIVSNPIKHAKGFTLYKVTSIAFPQVYPEAAKKVVVWKRYNDFKKLHSQLKQVHSKLNLRGKFPPFVKAKYFSRFEEEVIEERRRAAFLLLEFIATHPPLCNNEIFLIFFKSSYKVVQEPGSGQFLTNLDEDIIISIKSQTGDISKLPGVSSEDDATDTDSTTTNCDSFRQPLQFNQLMPTIDLDSKMAVEEEISSVQHPKQAVNRLSKRLWDLTSAKFRDNAKELDDKPGYCSVAEQYVEEAEIKEAMKNHRAAFDLYKKAISCWLSGVQSDMNHNRRKLIKEKTSMYLLRAEYIASYYLVDEIPEMGGKEQLPLSQLWRPVCQLASYKVLSVISKVMLVMDIGNHCLFIIKALNKSLSPVGRSDKCILPRGSPYIVNLYGIFESDSAVYLLLQHISTGKLWDYISPYFVKENNLHNEICSNALNPSNHYKEDSLNSYSSLELNEPLTHSATDLTLNLTSSQSSLSTQEDSYLDLINSYTENKLSESQTNKENYNSNFSSDNRTKLDISFEQKSLNEFPLPIRETDSSELATDLTLYKLATNGSLIEDGILCNEIFEILNPEIKRSSSKSCDIDTSILVEKAQELLKSVSQTLSKSESVHTVIEDLNLNGSPTHNNLSGSRVSTVKENVPLERLSSDICELSVQISNDFYGDADECSNLESTVVKTNSNKYNNASFLDTSKLLPNNGSRCYSPVSSGSEMGEIHWSGWGSEGRGLNQTIVLKWASQILVALNHLHGLGLIYRDLNPENLLVNGEGNICLTYKCKFPGVDPCINKRRENLIYVAPECLGAHFISNSADWWSYGVIMYNLITGKCLSYYHPGGVFDHSVIQIPDYIQEDAKSLLELLLKTDPNARLGSGSKGAEEIKSHPYFKSVNWYDVHREGLSR